MFLVAPREWMWNIGSGAGSILHPLNHNGLWEQTHVATKANQLLKPLQFSVRIETEEHSFDLSHK
jgi:hypothetical protein